MNRADLAQAETMLINQATVLQSLFTRLLEQGINAQHLPRFESFLRIALRAQSQCRASLETLAAIKNPQAVALVKQANIAHNQQVNNCIEPAATRTEKPEIQQTQLLEQQHGERLDFGAESTTTGSYQAVEAVGAVNRPQDGSR